MLSNNLDGESSNQESAICVPENNLQLAQVLFLISSPIDRDPAHTACRATCLNQSHITG